MRKIKISIVLVALCMAITIPHAYGCKVQLADRQDLDNDRFSFSSGLAGIQYINGWLKSFQALTVLSSERISPEERQRIGNLGWDTQNLAFYNNVKSVEGTLYKQKFEIRKLEYELALERKAAGKISQAEVAEKEKSYQEAWNSFQNFLAKFHVAD